LPGSGSWHEKGSSGLLKQRLKKAQPKRKNGEMNEQARNRMRIRESEEDHVLKYSIHGADAPFFLRPIAQAEKRGSLERPMPIRYD